MHHASRRLFYSSFLLVLTSLVVVLPDLPSAHATLTGIVCVASSTTVGCPASPPSFAGTIGTSLTLAVNIAGSDALNGAKISVATDPTVLSPTSISSGSVVPPPLLTLVDCVNGVPVPGSGGTCQTGIDGAGVVSLGIITIGSSTVPPTTGLIFTVTYSIVGSSVGTPIGFQTSTACANQSVMGTDDCIEITNGAAIVPENAQAATFANQAAAPTFNLSVLPASGTVVQGSTTTTSVTAKTASGTPGSVSFSTSALPSGVTAKFSPTGCTPTCSSTLTFSATTSASTGTATVTITGTATGVPSATTTFSLTVQQPQRDFSITVNPSSLTIVQGGTVQTSDIDLTGSNGFTDTIQLTPIVSGSSGPQASLSLNPVMLSSTATSAVSILSVSASATAALGTYTVSVNAIGVATGKSHLSPPIFVTIIARSASADFALLPNPATLFISPGNSGPTVILVRSLNGFAGILTFTASIFPSGPTVTLSQQTVVLVASSFWALVLRVNTITSTTPGSYTVTVTGTDGSISHSVKISVVVL